jgi:hypothetical protein
LDELQHSTRRLADDPTCRANLAAAAVRRAEYFSAGPFEERLLAALAAVLK